MDMPGIKVIEMNARDNLNEENRKKNKSAGRKEEYEKGCLWYKKRCQESVEEIMEGKGKEGGRMRSFFFFFFECRVRRVQTNKERGCFVKE